MSDRNTKWTVHVHDKKDGKLLSTVSYPTDCGHRYIEELKYPYQTPDSNNHPAIKIGMGLIDIRDVYYNEQLQSGAYNLTKEELAKWEK